ncbi:MAG: hypothetical protein NTZ08_02200 [Verrucomicrobia bacterium]|jgi:hypothetical protein|nr:hypothetical protein [Verrucomicrobiota bacterium]
MKLNKSIVALTSLVAFAATPLFAGTGKTFKETVVVEEEESSWYNAALSTGYDSLYMFRGWNVLRGKDGGYGNGLWWTDANFTWNISENDTLTVGGWQAFGLSKSNYREFDAYLNYVHSFGDLAVGLGYTFYYAYPQGSQDFANELNAKVAYALDLGFMSLTPSVTYFFNLGPDYGPGDEVGLVDTGSSYLLIRVDGSVPIIKDTLSIDPYAAFGLNFGYNYDQSGSFDGANNLEFGVSLPWKVNEIITVSGYVAYSYAFENIWGTTQPNTFWGGGKVAFAF